MTPERNTRAGLTLLETLIALLIMAMMAGLIAQIMGNGVAVFARSGAAQADLAQALARRDLRFWIEDALTGPAPDDDRALFTGHPDGFSALTLPSDGLFWPGRAVAVRLNSAGEVVASGESAEGISLELRSRIAADGTRVTLRYWGRSRPDTPPDWQHTWPAAAGLPELVQIRFSETSGRPLPPLTIRPAKRQYQSEMSLSSLLPPALPSRP